MRIITIVIILGLPLLGKAQKGYWQQRAEYTIDIDFDDATHRFQGKQKLIYHNNSGDTLRRVYYHLYFNAFQPGSMMDVRSRTIADPDPRVGDRIASLSESEIGYQKVRSLQQDGVSLKYAVSGTVLEVELARPIMPETKVVFEMDFEAQVPKQIRRSGRNNAEGVAYSMTQWYPKMAEYDREGWHADPYVAREFHGVWGDFDVNISIQKDYVLGGTGVVQNPQEVGHNYQDSTKPLVSPKGDRLTWRFRAERVHDFAWAADKHYTHDRIQTQNGPELHFLYLKDSVGALWDKLKPLTMEAFKIMDGFGKYPYPQFSVIQGGDGGMEYPMATLITGGRSMGGLVSVTVHEALHNWYYGVLATHEGKYPWMDEGFTTYAQNVVLDKLYKRNAPNPHARNYESYFSYVMGDDHEPATTHADFYHTNRAYGISAYSKGAVFLHQLGYVIGEDNLRAGLLRYFNEWGFKHPTPNDFLLVMEKVSGMELDWYLEQFIGTTNTIDYGIREMNPTADGLEIQLERIGQMPMPIDLVVTLTNGETQGYTIPLSMMRGEKKEQIAEKMTVLPDWPWVYPVYGFFIPFTIDEIHSIVIDPSGRLADVDAANNQFPPIEPTNAEQEKK